MGQETRKLLDEYEVLGILGRGGFSVLRKGVLKSSGDRRLVAIKTLKREGSSGMLRPRGSGGEQMVGSMSFPMWKQVSISDALLTNESSVMRKIVQQVSPQTDLYDVYEDQNGVHLVLELCSGGELFDRTVARAQYTEREATTVVRQIAEGLDALHKANIVHRDLKPENCLFSNEKDDSTLKIMDFGLSSVEEFTDPVVGLFSSINCLTRSSFSGQI